MTVRKCAKCGKRNNREYHQWCGECFRAYRKNRYWSGRASERKRWNEKRSKRHGKS